MAAATNALYLIQCCSGSTTRLGIQAEAIGERTVTKEEVMIPVPIYGRKKSTSGTHALPEDLPREVITIEPEGDITHLKKIGEEITEQLDVTPAKVLCSPLCTF